MERARLETRLEASRLFFHPAIGSAEAESTSAAPPNGVAWTAHLDRLLVNAARRAAFDWEATASHVRMHGGVAACTVDECRLRWASLDLQACVQVTEQHALFGAAHLDVGAANGEASGPSDFSIFTRDLGSEVRAIHEEVRMLLPSIGTDTDEDDSEGSEGVIVRPILRGTPTHGTASLASIPALATAACASTAAG